MDSSKTRLRKACDACSIRKVKCDESGPPCRSCASLDIPCTYNRPSKRRGPPNRHAEALKKQKIESDSSAPASSAPSFNISLSTTTAASKSNLERATLALSGESICPLPTLQRLVDDYFTFIHPLIPIPHEPTFRAAFARREDVSNKRFLALLAAMIGTLVASFPRRPKLHLRTEAEKRQYPHSMALVKKCHDVAIEARGPGYLDWSATVDDAAISYFLGLCSGYVYNIRRCRIYLGECITIIRVHGLHKGAQANAMSPTSPSSISSSSEPFGSTPDASVDLISQELGRRLFYICLVGFQTLQQLGSSDGRHYVPPETPTEPYPPLPLEVDDEYIFPTHVEAQPPGIVSQLTGFNANIRVFHSYNSLSAWEIAFGSGEIFDWERQRKLIWECLQKAKNSLADLPPELVLNQVQTPPPSMGWDGGKGAEELSRERRRIQYEIQKANIYISQLSTRSYLVDKYWSLYEAHKRLQKTSSQIPSPELSTAATVKSETGEPETPDADIHAQIDSIGQMMREERGLVIKDLLCLLRSVHEIHIEPNGASFTNKVRQIASTLLNRRPEGPDAATNEAAATTGPQPISTAEAENYLRTFLDILVRLEGVGTGTTTTPPPPPTTTTATTVTTTPPPPTTMTTTPPTTSSSGIYPSGTSPETHLRAMSYGSSTTEEEEELRQWASFKEFQRRFMESGGLLFSL
ncbi:hypothetical protein VTN77DRAFT_9603 [Rasamsonia byssochlamydoides]|uniref:uncharacterized protein n=1 Tax=Rasamsonia byssochlamydoides TaxID=89139 RepID=UPI0037443B23